VCDAGSQRPNEEPAQSAAVRQSTHAPDDGSQTWPVTAQLAAVQPTEESGLATVESCAPESRPPSVGLPLSTATLLSGPTVALSGATVLSTGPLPSSGPPSGAPPVSMVPPSVPIPGIEALAPLHPTSARPTASTAETAETPENERGVLEEVPIRIAPATATREVYGRTSRKSKRFG
jgi:hypothetical protein